MYIYIYIGLLTVSDSQRLGATSRGVTELKESPFFNLRVVVVIFGIFLMDFMKAHGTFIVHVTSPK